MNGRELKNVKNIPCFFATNTEETSRYYKKIQEAGNKIKVFFLEATDMFGRPLPNRVAVWVDVKDWEEYQKILEGISLK
ncbi:MAG: hypothetical protein WCX88_02330 [Patescibacteria group bacterium]